METRFEADFTLFQTIVSHDSWVFFPEYIQSIPSTFTFKGVNDKDNVP